MGRQPGWMVTQTGRPAMRSPGRPPIRHEVEQALWRKNAEGMTSEDAGIAVGVSGPVGSRWFRERGGMPSISLDAPSGRYLSFDEREEIALLKAQDHGVREIARRIGRPPSTISRELRRNAATRSGKLKYRAGVAQWKAELAASSSEDGQAPRRPRNFATATKSGWPVSSAVVTARSSWARARRRGRVETSRGAKTGAGRWLGVLSRSRTDCRSTSLMMSP